MTTDELVWELLDSASSDYLPSSSYALRAAADRLVALQKVAEAATHAHTVLTFEVTPLTVRKVAENLGKALDALRALESTDG